MTEALSPSKSPILRRALLGLFIAVPVSLVAWDVVQLSLAADAELATLCAQYYDRYAIKLAVLPHDAACSFLIEVRDPNPNQPLPSGDGKTLLGYVFSSHVLNGAVNKAGSQAVLNRLFEHRIDWKIEHHPGLPSLLHLAVQTHSVEWVERLLKAGANLRQKAGPVLPTMEGFDAADYARVLRIQAEGRNDAEAVRDLRKLEALLCNDKSVIHRASVGPQNIIVDSQTHTLLPMDDLMDWDAYPASNADVLIVRGPIGDHKSAYFALAGVWSYEEADMPCVPSAPRSGSECGYDPRQANTPSRLEAMLMVSGDPTVDGDLGWSETVKLPSRHSTPEREARLLGVDSLRVADLNKDGQFEVRAVARFKLGCLGEPYSESFDLKIAGPSVTRLPSALSD
jgi:hypothetical protein